MKINHLKSIGLIIIGIIISQLITFIFPPIDIEAENNNTSTKVPIEEPCLLAPRQVDTTAAKRHVAAYQTWTYLLPQSVNIDFEKHQIEYNPISFNPSDSTYIKAFVDSFLIANHRREGVYSNIPFVPAKDKSYYISKHDIDEALSAHPNATGINVYMAVRELDGLELPGIETHLYVLPTEKKNCTTLVDYYYEQQYALDLTYPCPKMCAQNSALNHLLMPIE
ncbi:hypothetical protein KFE94_11380 [bacterium SCSIO 12643]|nr:hypothetical protein KFE94_11380 [bacterium SCSIO 12643]